MMALIVCPKCGKQISDSAKICIHCGYNKEFEHKEEEKKHLFKSLPLYDQTKLFNEFKKIDAACIKFENFTLNLRLINKTHKIFMSLLLPWLFVTGILDELFLFYSASESCYTYMDIVLILWIIAVITTIIVLKILVAFYLPKRVKLIRHKFEQWLKEQKGLILSYDLSIIGEIDKSLKKGISLTTIGIAEGM